MVKTRQKNFRAFIFIEGDTEETIAYIAKNLELLKSLLLVFAYPLKEHYAPLLEYLNAEGFHFVQANNTEKLGLESNMMKESHKVASIDVAQTQMRDSTSPAQTANTNFAVNAESQSALELPLLDSTHTQDTLVLHRTIRSGEEIITRGDITIFGRINSGAHIQSDGNVQIFGVISGNVFCNGTYMILGKVGEGNILFQGEILDKTLLQYPYNKVYKKQDSIIIEELR